jgi:hypothetical protein
VPGADLAFPLIALPVQTPGPENMSPGLARTLGALAAAYAADPEEVLATARAAAEKLAWCLGPAEGFDAATALVVPGRAPCTAAAGDDDTVRDCRGFF